MKERNVNPTTASEDALAPTLISPIHLAVLVAVASITLLHALLGSG